MSRNFRFRCAERFVIVAIVIGCRSVHCAAISSPHLHLVEQILGASIEIIDLLPANIRHLKVEDRSGRARWCTIARGWKRTGTMGSIDMVVLAVGGFRCSSTSRPGRFSVYSICHNTPIKWIETSSTCRRFNLNSGKTIPHPRSACTIIQNAIALRKCDGSSMDG